MTLLALVFSTSEGHADTMWPRPLAPRPHSVMLLHELPVAYKASAEQRRLNEVGYARDPEVSCPEPDLPLTVWGVASWAC